MADTPRLLDHVFVTVEGLTGPPERELRAALVDVTVESSLHLPDVATLVVHDSGLRWVDEAKLEPGSGLVVSAKASDSESEHPIFDGEIVEIEPDFVDGAQLLRVRAFDRLHRLARGRHVRSFVNVTDGDLVRKIAQELGLHASAESGGQVHEYVFQNNETNLEFLRSRAMMRGCLLFVEGKTLHFDVPSAEGDVVEVKWGETLVEFHPRMTTVSQVTGATVRGWDPATRQEIVGQARTGHGAPDIGERRSGATLANAAFSLEAPILTADRPVRSQAEADRRAQAVADRHASRFVEADGECHGDSRVTAGTSVRVVNVGQRFSGTYFVTTARHVFATGGGYVTHFSISGQQATTLASLLAPDDSAGAAGGATGGLAVAIVTDNSDPDGLGRVKVKYPWLAPDHASDWARVVVPGGGSARGIAFLPEVNDEVLVGFELGDVHHPYVIGGLWNGQDKPPGDKSKVVSGGKVEQRVIRSRAGHTVTLDDSNGAAGITIEDKNGNVVFLDSTTDALRIKVKGDVVVEAQGSLSLKSRGKLSLDAQGAVEIKGMGVTVDGGPGTVSVKGTVINLN